ncbi:capsular exopolysaccharide family [Arenibacter nanhaiticus]|uniref:Capsular exopolysaccharide family n=1 Tax=Arenibacter nanhaiticus TaxID=558155 RepID=A0A1M6LZN4_9FLAO|nr:polysaccharide biosynthesis tyrosine autokinase [Arenibacter nanhaiticus]SHJ76580.1 capsular exopolysaccharide family [Arenibacter nanhaiticus]
MNEAPYNSQQFEEEESLNLKEILFKYLAYWPWFLATSVLAIWLGVVYIKYVPETYQSVAKIKIIDESKEMNIATDALSLLGGKSQVNLDNEVEVIKSYRLLSQVVDELQLNVAYYAVGTLKTTEIWNPPFRVQKNIGGAEINKPLEYNITLGATAFTVTDEDKNTYTLPYGDPKGTVANLPFSLHLNEHTPQAINQNHSYKIVLLPKKAAVMKLVNSLQVQSTNKNSDILSLSLIGQSIAKSEAILNTTIEKFNRDGILDRQMVSQNTLNFIDDRFIYLSEELDSIEGNKKEFKQRNNLSFIEADAGVNLQKKAVSEEEVFKLETQIALSKLLKETMSSQTDYQLLPADIGLENNSINGLVKDYNQMVLEREKLKASAGANNPTVMVLTGQLDRTKENISQTINGYQQQLGVSLKQLQQQQRLAGSQFSKLPEKEQLLRAIERQQSIKENLFLILLQKREEAAISLAVTSPSLKVVDYALTSNAPVAPKKQIILAGSLLLGLMLPFGILYIIFLLDTKIQDRVTIERANPEIPILAEIPFIEDNKSFMDADDRSVLAESFRILSTNVNYLLPKKEKGEGQVIYVSSTIKGEGKTLVALNLSLAYSSIKKKVLLVGSDLRNPQLHNYFDIDKNVQGLADYLHNPELNWKDCIHEGYNKIPYHKVCFSGSIPPNAPQLLSGDGFEKFITAAKKEFDYIIVDTAPTILVTDTLLISQHADATLFVTRAGYTDKRLLEFSKDLNKNKKLINMAYVLNDVRLGKGKGYGYGYNYGYGYGYGYSEEQQLAPWYKRILKRS